MATWPTGTKASTANLDSGTDSPRLARADIKQNVDNVNAIIDMFNISSPTDNQILKYNTANARFELDTDATGSAVAATTFVGDDSTGTAVNPGETFKIAGGTNITTAVSGDTVTITGPDISSFITSSALTGLASETYVGTQLTGLASETYVGTQISNLVDSSPEALNTLNELAAALGDDANFATTVTNSIASKLEKGNLQVNSTTISPITTNDNLQLEANGTGKLVLDGLYWPQTDGTNGQVLSTDGSSQLSWSTPAPGSVTNEFIINLDDQIGSDLGSSEFKMQISEIYDGNSLLSITSNTFQLAPGDYIITNMKPVASTNDTQNHKIILRDTTNSTDTVTMAATTTVVTGTRGTVFSQSTYFNVASTTTFEMRCGFSGGASASIFDGTKILFRKL